MTRTIPAWTVEIGMTIITADGPFTVACLSQRPGQLTLINAEREDLTVSTNDTLEVS